jgi:hypothetical protein
MRKIMTICAMLGAFSALGLAENWNGTLLNAVCVDQHKTTKSCDARPSTETFILDVNGTQYRLDGASNERAREAMKSRADRASNPEATKATPVNAKVTGELRGSGKIHADLIEVQ